MASQKEKLEVELLINIGNAMTSLDSMDKNSKEFGMKFNVMLKEIQALADSLGRSFSEVGIKVSQAFNTSFAKKFGSELQVLDLQTKKLSADIDALNARSASANNMLFSPAQPTNNTNSTGRFAGQMGKYDTGAGRVMYNDWKDVGPMLENTGKKARSAAQGFNVLRSAMGFLVAMGMSAFMRGLITMFKKIIDSASQAEQAFIKLSIAEKSISQLGVDITPKELTDIIEKVNAAYLSVSKIDAQKMVSSLAVLTKDLKLSAKEYEKLAMAIPLVAQQAGVTIDNATNQVITGLTKSGRGWADLGITVDAAIIRQKAVSAGIVESAEAYNALTAEQKQQVEVLALLQILEDNTLNNKAEQEKYNNSLAGSQTALNAAWEDFLAAMGKLAAPTIIQFLQSLTTTLTYLNESLEKNSESASEFGAKLAGASAVARILGNSASLAAIAVGAIDLGKVYKDAYDQAKKYQSDLSTLTDTPTGTGSLGDIESEADNKRQEAFDKFAQELAESELKLAQEREDINIDLGRQLVDIETEYDRKRADANRDYAEKVRDINQSYNEDIKDIEQKQAEEKQKKRNDDLKREQEYQNKLLEMRENYLMSLEDALHSRDARQVLKLMRQYELDKLQAARRHEIDQQQADVESKTAQRSIQIEINKAKAKRDIALKAAEQDRQDKLAQLKIDEKREIDDAKLKTRRKLDDLRKANSDRLALMAASLVQEYKLTGEWVVKMVGLYRRYYTDIAQVYTNIAALQRAATLAGQAGVPASAPGNTGRGVVQYPVPAGPPVGRNDPRRGRSAGRAAEGGIFTASTPTNLMFGEAGAEVASVMPLNRLGKNVGKMMSGNFPGSSGAGKMTIELLLSPDLESRVVANSLDATANIITRTMRGK